MQRGIRVPKPFAWMSGAVAVVAAAVAASTSGGTPVPEQGRVPDGVAFLYAYRINAGQDSAFRAGYRRHLDWHAAQHDSLSWLAWDIVAGEGLGWFVNGVFGVAAAAMDVRVRPGADAADAAMNVDPYSRPVYRHAYRVRADLSRAARLESAHPAARQHVAFITPAEGAMGALESALRELRASDTPVLDYTVYERIAGGSLPVFMLISQSDRWADIADERRDPLSALLRTAGTAVADAKSEVWAYRRDLTYIPNS